MSLDLNPNDCNYCCKGIRTAILKDDDVRLSLSLYNEHKDGGEVYIGIRQRDKDIYGGNMAYEKYEKINYCPICGRKLNENQ